MSDLTVRRFVRMARDYVDRAKDSPAPVSLVTVARDFPAWIRHQHGSPLAAADPWITFGARRALDRIIGPTTRVFEYGSGGSTIYFAERCEVVISVEHDPIWYQSVSQEIERFGNVDLVLAPPTAVSDESHRPDSTAYRSSDPTYDGMWFRDYVRTIERYPDGYFDVVMVDGRARVDAFVHGTTKIREGGAIVLDDSERQNYAAALAAVRDWPSQRYVGPKPYVPQFCETTIWRKPSSRG